MCNNNIITACAYLDVVDIACSKIMYLSHSVRTTVVSGICIQELLT